MVDLESRYQALAPTWPGATAELATIAKPMAKDEKLFISSAWFHQDLTQIAAKRSHAEG